MAEVIKFEEKFVLGPPIWNPGIRISSESAKMHQNRKCRQVEKKFWFLRNFFFAKKVVESDQRKCFYPTCYNVAARERKTLEPGALWRNCQFHTSGHFWGHSKNSIFPFKKHFWKLIQKAILVKKSTLLLRLNHLIDMGLTKTIEILTFGIFQI